MPSGAVELSEKLAGTEYEIQILIRMWQKSSWENNKHNSAIIQLDAILRREGWEGGFQLELYGGLGSGQYGWPECKGFQAFCGGKGGREDSCWSLVAA